MVKIIILGNQTCNFHIGKAQTSLLIKFNNQNLVYDFGYMVYNNLKKLGFSNNSISSVIISHFHPDHFSDLLPFFHSCLYSKDIREKELVIYSNSYVKNLKEILKKALLNPPEFDEIFKFKEINENLRFGELIFKVNFSYHHKNISLKFKDISITGDLDFTKDDLNFFKNSKLCFLNSGNLNENEIISFKENLNIDKLVVLHSYRNLDKNFLLKKDIVVAEEFTEFLVK